MAPSKLAFVNNDDKVPLPLLFAKPVKAQLRISPGEGWLAWTARGGEKGVLNIWVQQREPPGQPRQVTFEDERDACDFFTFSVDDRTLLYLAESSHGTEMYHLYAVDLDDPGLASRDLIKDPKVTAGMGFAGPLQFWRPLESPRHIFIATGSGSLFWEVSSVNIDTGDRKVVAKNPVSQKSGLACFALRTLGTMFLRLVSCGHVDVQAPRAPVFWFADRKTWRFRGRAEASLQGGRLHVHFSVQRSDGRWHPLESIDFKDVNMQLIGSTAGSGTMRMHFGQEASSVELHSCLGSDITHFARYDVDSGIQLGVAVDSGAKKSDVSSWLAHPATGEIQALEYDCERPEWDVIDPAIAGDIQFLERHFSGLSVSILPRPLRDDVWVLHVSGDIEPGVYYIYERSAKRVVEVFRSRPQLSNWVLGKMHPTWVTARDGERVLCYVSLPMDVSLGQNAKLPLVLFIHGGPNARDHWGFSPVCQLLTSRGMAVLQVNYRGSTGLGRRWVQLGMDGAFAAAMQHDIEDAARWAVAKGIADPARLAIVGASFGGYAALYQMTLGATHSWRAGVAICAVSAVGKAGALGFRGDPIVKQYWRQVYGDAATDMAKAKAASPLFHVDQVKAPVLVIHGAKDQRVPVQMSDQLAAALRAKGMGGGYITYPDEGHGIRKEANILDMWSRVERFLCLELGLPDPAASERLLSSSSSPARAHWEDQGPRRLSSGSLVSY
eukprot:TRINITY_DN44990_c0_g1_i2.p1 TRINITY_DN44990_c0_g1~~TRINITY_DN44990_c0_g1_i2.p1  ORF type:complete len:742 (+),score=54.70 TRINITY_DN44990_c0_g1_i2:62-2227(+)